MPKVPVRNSRVQQQTIAPSRQSANVPIEAVGGGSQGAFKAAIGLVGQVQRLENQAIKKSDEIANNQTEGFLWEIEKELYHNNQTGSLKSRGEGSVGAAETSKVEWDSRINELSKTLKTDGQRKFLNDLNLRRRKSLDLSVENHLSTEIKKVDIARTTALVGAAQERAVEFFNNPAEVQDALATQSIEIRKAGDRNGLPRESIIEQIKESGSKTHSMIISRMVDGGQEIGAERYLKDNIKDLTANDKIKMQKIVADGVLRRKSQFQTDKIVTKDINEASSLKSARKIRDPKLRDETVRRVKQRFNEQNAESRAIKKQNYNTAFLAVENSKDFDAIPNTVLSTLSAKEVDALKRRADQVKLNEAPVTDNVLYYSLIQQATDKATQKLFIGTNLQLHRADLGDVEFNKLTKLQDDLQKGKPIKGIQTKNSIVKNTLQTMGIEFGNKASDEDLEKASKFWESVEAITDQRQSDLGRPITNAEFREIANDLSVEVVTDKGFFFDTTKRVFELDPNEVAELQIENVPERDIVKIEAALKKAKKPVNNKNIINMYSRKLETTRAAKSGL